MANNEEMKEPDIPRDDDNIGTIGIRPFDGITLPGAQTAFARMDGDINPLQGQINPFRDAAQIMGTDRKTVSPLEYARNAVTSTAVDRGVPVGTSLTDARVLDDNLKQAHSDLRRIFGLGTDASDDLEKKALAAALQEKDSPQRTQKEEHRFLGVRDDASAVAVEAAREALIQDYSKRLDLPVNSSKRQIIDRQKQLDKEATNICLGLDKNAPKAVSDRALADETALQSEHLPFDDKLALLGLTAEEGKDKDKVDKAMRAAEDRQLERYKIDRKSPDYKEQLLAARNQAAQDAQRHKYGLRPGASFEKVMEARQNNSYMDKLYANLPLDMPRTTIINVLEHSQVEGLRLGTEMNNDRERTKQPLNTERSHDRER